MISNTIISIANKIHNNKYDYLGVEYRNGRKYLKLNCQKHGVFTQRYTHHVTDGHGCRSCAYEYKADNATEDLDIRIKQFKKIHYDRYDYSLVKKTTIKNKISIICHKHGVFNQVMEDHLRGRGCPKCRLSKGEIKISKILEDANIKYISQKKFDDCIGNKHKLLFDFYLTDLNICIEYDGMQHFLPVKAWGGLERFEKVKKFDRIKNKFCKLKKIKLIRIPYTKFNKIEEILKRELFKV
jgi:hypothetical protein